MRKHRARHSDSTFVSCGRDMLNSVVLARDNEVTTNRGLGLWSKGLGRARPGLGSWVFVTAKHELSVLKGLLVDYVRHGSGIATIVTLQYVDDSLHAAARHPQRGIWGEPRLAAGAGKVVK